MWDDIVQDLVQRSEAEGTLPEATPEFLRKIWPALVGESVASMSTPVNLDGRTLRIEARDAGLVEEWKRTPLPLLRRIRPLSPWPIETLVVEHNPGAGCSDSSPTGDRGQSPPTDNEHSSSDDPDHRPAEALDEQTREAMDPELRTLIESIEEHRRHRDS